MSTPHLIMVVDDDDDIRDSLRDVLRRMSYDVVVAKDGLDALTQLIAGPRPDAILLDLMMPVMDGFQFMLELRNYSELETIPVLIITAAGNARVEATKLAAAGHIQKPFKTEDLRAALLRVI